MPSLSSMVARTARLIHQLPIVLGPLAAILSIYLYAYPIFLGCVFPSIDGSFGSAFSDTVVQHRIDVGINPLDTRPNLAPFRLLVLADPQLEGDSSLPDPEDAFDQTVAKHWASLTAIGFADPAELFKQSQGIAADLITKDIPTALRAMRKRLDLWGNDYYLAHIYRTMLWWSKPTHVTVLGDLIGSQWVDDEEFERRGSRYWNKVMSGAKRVPDDIMEASTKGRGIVLKMDDLDWGERIINIAGNHDIGYAGDITKARVERYEKKYGKANWDVRFEYPACRMNTSADGTRPMLHLVVLNSMLLDTPVMDEDLQSATYTYLNDVVQNRLRSVEERDDFTLVLTHVPLHKREGICADAPFFDFWDEDSCTEGDCKPGALKEQYHLSDFASQSGLLQAIFGMGGDLHAPAQGRGRPGLVLNGHDHEGCDVWHYIPKNSTFEPHERTEEGNAKKTVWEASKWTQSDKSTAHTGIREITVRSMMGEFGGNAGLLSAWFDSDKGEWQHDVKMCRLGVQHIWWAIHIVDLMAMASVLLSVFVSILQKSIPVTVEKGPEEHLKTE